MDLWPGNEARQPQILWLDVRALVSIQGKNLNSASSWRQPQKGRFLEEDEWPKLTQEEIESWNKLITIEEVKSVIKISFPKIYQMQTFFKVI